MRALSRTSLRPSLSPERGLPFQSLWFAYVDTATDSPTLTTPPAQAACRVKAWLKSLRVKRYGKSGGKVRKRQKCTFCAAAEIVPVIIGVRGGSYSLHALLKFFIYSFAAVVSNSWGLGRAGGGGSSRRQVINRTKHPKWGQCLSPFLLFSSCQWWQRFRRKNLYPISPPPLLGFPFPSWPSLFFFFSAHPSWGGKCIARFESPGQGWYFPLLPSCIC